MRRAGFLFDEIVAWPNLLLAARKAARGKRGRPEVAQFLFDVEPELLSLQRELEGGTWQVGPFRRFRIRDPKPRTISAAPFRDRVVHHALMNVLDPLFERRLIADTYACRRGKGAHRAVSRLRWFARRHPFFLKGDVEACFETVDHQVLKGQLRRIFKDERLSWVLDEIIDSGGEDGVGLPIGNLTSQYFANHYLGRLDLFVKQELRAKAYLRYMDDFVVLGANKSELHGFRARIRRFLSEDLGLTLKERVTRVAPSHNGIPFLGFMVYPGVVKLHGSRKRRTLQRIRQRQRGRLNGELSTEAAAHSIQSSLAHIEHAQTLGLRRGWFEDSCQQG